MQLEKLDECARRCLLLVKRFQRCSLALRVFHLFIVYLKIRAVKFAFYMEVVSFFLTRRISCPKLETPYTAPLR